MATAPLPVGFVVKPDSPPAYITPVFVNQPVKERKGFEDRTKARERYLNFVRQRPSYRMVKCLGDLGEMRPLDKDLPCSLPSTPDTSRPKLQWNNQNFSFRTKMRLLHAHIMQTPCLKSAVMQRLEMKEPSQESDS